MKGSADGRTKVDGASWTLARTSCRGSVLAGEKKWKGLTEDGEEHAALIPADLHSAAKGVGKSSNGLLAEQFLAFELGMYVSINE